VLFERGLWSTGGEQTLDGHSVLTVQYHAAPFRPRIVLDFR